MIIVVKIFPPAQGISLTLPTQVSADNISVSDQIIGVFTVPNFLALIIFAIFIGLATSSTGEKGQIFGKFLQADTEISMKAVSFVMYSAPIGFFAFFAILTAELGPKLLETHLRITIILLHSFIL